MNISQNIIQKIKQIYGISDITEVIYNPNYEKLYIEETKSSLFGNDRAIETKLGAIAINSGIFTGRSPKDKYIVYDDFSMDKVWWSGQNIKESDNNPITEKVWKILKNLIIKHLSGKRLFVFDSFCGPRNRFHLNVRFITEIAWQAHFVKNMLIQPSKEELENFKPDFTVLFASKCKNLNWRAHGLNSENFIAFNLKENMQIIGGTWYNGEVKKGLFSIMNYFLPAQGIASMHCSANIGKKKDVSIFFGLSGTGKTTLSSDVNRKLIGDDEHGWDEHGIFNFEGGCYAKVINLSKEADPSIYSAIRKNALLENVSILSNGSVDFSNAEKTENTRVSYPIYHIKNSVKSNDKIGHAKKIIFLTADAFAVFPLVSCLTQEQAEYYFLSGFTSKLADTEQGVNKPIPVFSACFGAAFLTLHPIHYGKILRKRMKFAKSKVYLVNTGWDSNFQRISIKKTRFIIDSILNNEIDKVNKKKLPIFNLFIPKKLLFFDENALDPRYMYKSDFEWTLKARKLAKKFIENFRKYNNTKFGLHISRFGPKL